MVWPLPQDMSWGTTAVTLTSGFSFSANSQDAILTAAFERYQAIIFGNGSRVFVGAGAGSLTSLVVTFQSSSTQVPLQLGVNESFVLQVPSPANANYASLIAPTVWGALRGLETFSQLITTVSGSPVIPCTPVAITDFPRFPHRALMLDSARHFLPVSVILRNIDALAWNKANTLHWHLTDAQSFPLESASYPNLTAGAYTPSEVYTPTDIATVIQYGLARGIRVLPELDMPGHAYAWGAGYPITANCPDYDANINNVPLNPTNPLTMTIVEAVLKEVSAAFIDDIVHIGGDEVEAFCWTDDPTINAWLKNKGWTTDQLLQYFITQADADLTANGKTPTHWIEIFNAGIKVPENTIFQVWQSVSDVVQVVQAGYRAIVSNSDKWYMNCGFNPGCTYQSWQNVYGNDPVHSAGSTLTPAQAALVLGGEAVLFGEYADATNVDPQVWPRTAAVMERLWSNYEATQSTTAALPRLTYHRCRLLARGINTSPVGPGFCPDAGIV